MRKKLTYTVTDEGRDLGKVFELTEMSADASERWALRLIFALMNSGVDLPEDVESMGLAGIIMVGFKAMGKIPYIQAEPLFDDLMSCVQYIPEPSKPNVVRAIFDGDIEEVKTRLVLKKEVFNLHTGFFTNAAPSV